MIFVFRFQFLNGDYVDPPEDIPNLLAMSQPPPEHEGTCIFIFLSYLSCQKFPKPKYNSIGIYFNICDIVLLYF